MPDGFTHIPINRGDILERAVSEKTCAILVEPIQGEGGVRPICPKLFEKIRKHCDRVNAALIVDEVQTGMGRTGKLFAYQHSCITPDILTSAKSLGCGFPIGAMLCREWISEHFVPGTHGSTYGGNPLGTAVAGKALETINQPELLSNVLSRGEQLMQGLNELNERYKLFKTIRGKGLLIGGVLKEDYEGQSGKLTKLTMQEGLMTLAAGPDVHRFAPPLIISESEIDEALTMLAQAYCHFIKQT